MRYERGEGRVRVDREWRHGKETRRVWKERLQDVSSLS